ncbi:MAG: FKBP-type peptidyl-prolyl cis-trans isomerase [Myxococcota bacterium]|jgi:FKBP-type peptidyl-prolyl cis-trans isomerase FkpA|nr:FKBP-type peptidyl-prolyl cis-trans isomerase [Myxococcota bacterium]
MRFEIPEAMPIMLHLELPRWLRIARTTSLVAVLVFVLAALGCDRFTAPPGVDSLLTEDLKVGEGDPVEIGDLVRVHYTGWLYDPSKQDNRGAYFDSSRQRGLPLFFQPNPGSDGVIEGWHRGVLGMRLGGLRQITIPPDLAYGDQAAAGGIIVPNSTLVFELELVRLEKTKD